MLRGSEDVAATKKAMSVQASSHLRRARAIFRAGRRDGSILLIAVIAMVVLLGCAALTIDVGMVGAHRLRLQSYCDAAALAGGAQLPSVVNCRDAAAAYYQVNRTGSTTAPVGSNGTYNIGGDTVVVTTPYSDSYTNSKGWDPDDLTKVTTTSPLPMAFAQALGLSTVNVTTSSVALRAGSGQGEWGTGDGCLFALDQGFALSCNTFKVGGSVCANSDINIGLNTVWIGNTLHAKTACNLSGNQIRGGFRMEYGTTYKVSSNNADIKAIVKTPQQDLTPPLTYKPANYATDFHIDQYFPSDLTIVDSKVITAAGTYYVGGNLNINANNTFTNNSTFIVQGSVNINTNNLTLGYHENYMSFYLLGGGTINVNQNNLRVYGDLYAPNGYINCTSNNVHKGWWIARKITVNCNNFKLDGLPGRSGGNSLCLVE